MATFLDKHYWKQRYQNGETGWDVGFATPPITAFADRLTDREAFILIPGAGSGYEAAYFWEKGFRNVFVCDWAEEAFDRFRQNVPHFPESQLLINDFFTLDGAYDYIIEQTFFCAINPVERPRYAQKAHSLLRTEGVLAGLLFNRHFPFDGPPFGGTKTEYWAYFEPYFDILTMETANNSIAPRAGNELWFEMRKR